MSAGTASEDTTTVAQPLSRELIIATARTLLVEVGFEQLSLRRLAGVLGVTAPALYAHVDDKGDLLAALADTGFRELARRFEAIEASRPIEHVREQSLAYVEYAVENPDLFRVMFLFRPGALEVPGVDNVLPAASEVFERATLMVVAAIDAGEIHPDHDALQTSLTVWTTAHGIAHVMLLGFTSIDDSWQTSAAYTVDVCLQGLSLPRRRP